MLARFRESAFVRYVRETRSFRLGLLLAAFWIIVAIAAPLIAPYPPTQPHPAETLQAPSSKYWFGTDKDGMDVLSRTIYAPRIDLAIAMTSTAIALTLGLIIGTIAGYFGGRGGALGVAANWSMRVVDMVQAFPVFIFALALVAALGASTGNVIAAMVFVNTPVFIWLTRSEVLSVRERPFIEADALLRQPGGTHCSDARPPQFASSSIDAALGCTRLLDPSHCRNQLRGGRGQGPDARMGFDGVPGGIDHDNRTVVGGTIPRLRTRLVRVCLCPRWGWLAQLYRP